MLTAIIALSISLLITLITIGLAIRYVDSLNKKLETAEGAIESLQDNCKLFHDRAAFYKEKLEAVEQTPAKRKRGRPKGSKNKKTIAKNPPFIKRN